MALKDWKQEYSSKWYEYVWRNKKRQENTVTIFESYGNYIISYPTFFEIKHHKVNTLSSALKFAKAYMRTH